MMILVWCCCGDKMTRILGLCGLLTALMICIAESRPQGAVGGNTPGPLFANRHNDGLPSQANHQNESFIVARSYNNNNKNYVQPQITRTLLNASSPLLPGQQFSRSTLEFHEIKNQSSNNRFKINENVSQHCHGQECMKSMLQIPPNHHGHMNTNIGNNSRSTDTIIPRQQFTTEGASNNFQNIQSHTTNGRLMLPVQKHPSLLQSSAASEHIGASSSMENIKHPILVEEKIKTLTFHELPLREISTSSVQNMNPQQDKNLSHAHHSNRGSVNPFPDPLKMQPTHSQDEMGKPGPPKGSLSEASQARRGGGGIVFPDGLPKRFTPNVGERGPTCANGSTFCITSDNYPRDYLNNILGNSANIIMELLGSDVMPTNTDIENRIQTTDENPLCPSVEQVVFPKMAQNADDKWLFVVNQDQYKQGVHVEICMKEGPCSMTEGFPLGYKTSCHQKFIYRKMLALTENGEPSSDSFRLPSCCSCQIKSEDITARLGVEPQNPQTSAVRNRKKP